MHLSYINQQYIDIVDVSHVSMEVGLQAVRECVVQCRSLPGGDKYLAAYWTPRAHVDVDCAQVARRR